MSAYQCTPEHIAFICAVYGTVCRCNYTMGALFDLLTDANAESVAYRYREPKIDHGKRSVPFPEISVRVVDLNIGAIFKSIACLEYQCCEPDGWQRSKAFRALDELRSALLARLPGYDQNDAWGLPKLRLAVSAPAASAPAASAPAASAPVPSLCATITGNPGELVIVRGTGGTRCAAEIVCNPDEPKRWQLPVWRVAKGREDCRTTSDHALTYALTSPAACA